MEGPELDGRRRDDLFEHASGIAPYYTDEWDPEGDDAGTALLRLFAELAGEVTERLDRVPEKHRVAFYEALGFSRRPPQAARLPLSVAVADGVTENVTVPAGTQAVGGTPEQTFEVAPGDGFEATPARPTAAYSVAPGTGEIYEHPGLLDGGDERLFGGPGDGRQEHALYVGHAGQLAVEGSPDDPTTVRVTVETGTPTADLADRLVWEFYGERGDETGWHEVDVPSGSGTDLPGEPYEAIAADAVRSLAEVVERLETALAETPLEPVVGPLVAVLRRLREAAGDPEVQESIGTAAEAFGRLVEALDEGDAGDAVREDLRPAVERLAGELEEGPVEGAVREELLPALADLAAALEDGPVEEAVRTALVPAVEGFSETLAGDETLRRLGTELERVLEGLDEGEATGPIVRDAGEALDGLGDALDIDVELPPGEAWEADGLPVEDVLRALIGVLDRLRESVDPSAVAAAVEALAAVVAAVAGAIGGDSTEDALEEVAAALETLRRALDDAGIDEPFRAFLDALDGLVGVLADGRVGAAVREDLAGSIERLAAAAGDDEAVRDLLDALAAVFEVLAAGPVEGAVREDLLGALDDLSDELGGTAVGEPLGPLLGAPERLREFDPAAAEKALRTGIQERFGGDGERDAALRTVDLAVDGTPTETTVGGVESLWIRARVPEPERGSDLFETRVGGAAPDYDPPVAVGPVPAGTVPIDTLLSNDTELSTDADTLHPLGKAPRRQDAFYVGSEAALTKAGATIEVALSAPPDTSDVAVEVDAEVAWEYWDGEAWSRLDVLPSTGEPTRNLREPGSVRFRVPDDLEATSVAGHDGHWIRARLVDGDYGRFEARRQGGSGEDDAGSDDDPNRSDSTASDSGTASESWVTEHEVDPPAFGGVTVRYTREGILQPASHLVTRNNLAYSPDLVAAERSPFAPFVPLPDGEQALYLGFDRPLDDGPITLLFDVDEVEYDEGFHPRVRWERPTAGGEWRRLDVRDGTEGFTERGIVSLTFPEATLSATRFGAERHWIRARVAGDRFVDAPSGDGTGGGGTDPAGPEPCGEAIRTAPPAGDPGRERPTIEGLYRNAGWARNVRTVEGELLGSSDGTQDLAVTVANPPATDLELWVDELGALSEGRRRELREDPDRAVEAEAGPDGEPSAFWVRWTAVGSFLDSGGDDRHYVLDPATGRIRFGDGNRGRIPPRGRDNIRASYRTGGGADGNVPAGAVGELKSSIPFVDAATNPLPADGGADEEAVGDVLDRAPKELRDRGRAVTEADVERVALDASRRLARARCLSAMDRAGERAPGWVTLLVVPAAPDEKPVPSVTLREEVRSAVSDRAAATLVADPEQLVVRGPSYVSVSVEATLAAAGAGSLSALEERATAAVGSFLHPLSGGPGGEGWSFGEPPCHSDFYALLERTEGVDHVDDLVLRFRGTDATVTVREGDAAPGMSPDALVHSGSHDLRATRTTGTGTGGS